MDPKRKAHSSVGDPLTSPSVFVSNGSGSNPTRRLAARTTRQGQGALRVAAELPPFRYAPDPLLPKTQAKLLPSLAAAIARPKRWSKLAVASNIVGQLGLMIVTGKWPPQPSTGNTMRGIDFYPWKDFLRALIHGAHLFQAENGYVPPLASPTRSA